MFTTWTTPVHPQLLPAYRRHIERHAVKKGDELTTKAVRYITYKQAQELSGLSRSTIWRLIKSSEVEASKIGTAVRIDSVSLLAFIQRSSVNARARPGE